MQILHLKMVESYNGIKIGFLGLKNISIDTNTLLSVNFKSQDMGINRLHGGHFEIITMKISAIFFCK